MEAALLQGVCASGAWVEHMLRLRPYRTEAELVAANREATAALDADGDGEIGERDVVPAFARYFTIAEQ